MIGMSFMRAGSQAHRIGSSLDRALTDHNRAPAYRRAGQLAAADPHRQLHHAGPSHLVTLLDAHEVLTIRVSTTRGEITGEGRGCRTSRRIFGNAGARSKHARVECVPLFG